MKITKRTERFCCGRISFIVLSVLLTSLNASMAGQEKDVEYFRMISSVEYVGQNEFRNHAEAEFKVTKKKMADRKVKYTIASDETGELSFVIDRKTNLMSNASKGLRSQQTVNNVCVNTLDAVTKDNVGKTWKQSFDLSSLGDPYPKKLSFTLTAKQCNTKQNGKMLAVRALSEPFKFRSGNKKVKSGKGKRKAKDINATINAVYLFDSQVEEVYMSATVFSARRGGILNPERLQHEVGTYQLTSDGGKCIKLGLDSKCKEGKAFAKLMSKVGFVGKPLKVKSSKKTPLPEWAKLDALKITQVANICAASACEGAINPVGTVFVSANQMLQLQTSSAVGTALAKAGSVGGGLSLGAGTAILTNAGGSLGSAAALGTTGAIGGSATAGGIVAASDGGGSGSAPASP